MPLAEDSLDRVLTLHNRHSGEILRIRRVRASGGETVLDLQGSLPPRMSGPPLHVHMQVREENVVTAGSLGVRIGRHKAVVPAGQSAVFPVGTVHTWWNAGDEIMEVRGRATPAGDLDSFVQAMFAVLNAGRAGRPSIFYLAHVLWRHRRTQAVLLPPRLIQAITFPIVVLLGHALGKYRGVDWPGSPASCTGAPEPDSVSALAASGPVP